MEIMRSTRAWTVIGAVALALTAGAMVRRSGEGPRAPSEDLRDAVASPAVSMGARFASPSAGYFASPAERPALTRNAVTAARLAKLSRALDAKAASLRREAARAVPAR